MRTGICRSALAACAGLVILSAGCATRGPEVDALATAAPAIATVAPTAVAGWNTFTEPTLGYTLSYPQDAIIDSGVSPAGVYTTRLQFRIPGADGYQGMVVRVEPNPGGRGLEVALARLYSDYLMSEPPADLLAALPQKTIAGLAATQMGGADDFALVLPVGDYVYQIAPVHDMASTSMDPQALALFEQILGTLQVRR
jgi:hypothetical protein